MQTRFLPATLLVSCASYEAPATRNICEGSCDAESSAPVDASGQREGAGGQLARDAGPVREAGASTSAFSDLPPVPNLHFQIVEPASPSDYPYGLNTPAPQAPAPRDAIFLSAAGSADPEGTPVEIFWNVQDPATAYLPLDADPSDPRVTFTPTRPGLYTVTLQVTELAGLRQTGQAQLQIAVAPVPCAEDGFSDPCSDEVVMSGGTFLMGSPNADGGDNERPQHPAALAPFALDKYEVTVGRFRRFLIDYDPASFVAGVGAHPLVPDSGWNTDWLFTLPATSDQFKFAISECGGTWTDEPGPNEARPISCITWFEAFAFCSAEGKRLPTEAEWEYAAAGGDEQRLYPWGDESPDVERVVFACLADGESSCSDADLPTAGSAPLGAGRFGHLDLAGSLWEWTLDVYLPYTEADCANCAPVSADESPRVFRGGDFKFADPVSLQTTTRYAFGPAFPDPARGLRCARSAP